MFRLHIHQTHLAFAPQTFDRGNSDMDANQQRQQWQNTLRARLMDKAKEGEQYREIIEQCRCCQHWASKGMSET